LQYRHRLAEDDVQVYLTNACSRRLSAFLVAAALTLPALAASAGTTYSCQVLYFVEPLSSYQDDIPSSCAGGQTVGEGTSLTLGGPHAMLFTAPSGTVLDLNPSGFLYSNAFTTDGTQQVGVATNILTGPGLAHAMLWSGTSDSAVDLNPAGFTSSWAIGTDTSQQVGSGSGVPTGGNTHALLWSGTAESVVDLSPTNIPGIVNSVADGVGGANQVGYGYATTSGVNNQALLWSGSAASAVDLNPAGNKSFRRN
jgi:hypothetical protein